MARNFAGTHAEYLYKKFVKNLKATSSFAATGTADAGGSATTLIDAAGLFITRGVRVGDIATNSSDPGASAAVTAVVSETQITTAPLAGGGTNTWANGNNYSIAPSSAVVRVAFDSAASAFVRTITAFTNGATGTSRLRIYYGNNAADSEFDTRVAQNTLFQIDPDLTACDEPIIVELDSGGSASINVSFEFR